MAPRMTKSITASEASAFAARNPGYRLVGDQTREPSTSGAIPAGSPCVLLFDLTDQNRHPAREAGDYRGTFFSVEDAQAWLDEWRAGDGRDAVGAW